MVLNKRKQKIVRNENKRMHKLNQHEYFEEYIL